MTRTGFTLLFFVPAFLIVFVGVRAVWLVYVSSLSESQLHVRVFDHSKVITLLLWGLCIAIAVLIAQFAAHIVSRKAARS